MTVYNFRNKVYPGEHMSHSDRIDALRYAFNRGETVIPNPGTVYNRRPSDILLTSDDCDHCGARIADSPYKWSTGLQCPECGKVNRQRLVTLDGEIHGKL